MDILLFLRSTAKYLWERSNIFLLATPEMRFNVGMAIQASERNSVLQYLDFSSKIYEAPFVDLKLELNYLHFREREYSSQYNTHPVI